MEFYPGFNIQVNTKTMDFKYGEGVFGPEVEIRRLDDIRSSLAHPHCTGPEVVYSIAMDTGEQVDKQAMLQRNLLYGVVTYAKGILGVEPVRSQGHIHSISASCNASTCEVYEIFDGEAYIYMQESGNDNPGRCYAVYAKAGDVVIVPPGWVHATINANVQKTMTFGAWCVRDYGFDYVDVHRHKGIAFFPIIVDDEIQWKANENYNGGTFKVKAAQTYPQFHLEQGKPIYTQFKENPDKFLFVSNPKLAEDVWKKI